MMLPMTSASSGRKSLSTASGKHCRVDLTVWSNRLSAGTELTDATLFIDLNRASPHNWLEDNFWTNCAWLDGRSPLPVNSNWWLALFNDDTVPLDARQHGPNWITPWQVRRAAWMTHRVLEFKERLLSYVTQFGFEDRTLSFPFRSQELHPNTTRTGTFTSASSAS